MTDTALERVLDQIKADAIRAVTPHRFAPAAALFIGLRKTPPHRRNPSMTAPDSPVSLLPRGVYRAACLSSAGNLVYFAIDFQHREVEGARVELPDDSDQVDRVLADLWRKLDAADPEHSRRARATR